MIWGVFGGAHDETVASTQIAFVPIDSTSKVGAGWQGKGVGRLREERVTAVDIPALNSRGVKRDRHMRTG